MTRFDIYGPFDDAPKIVVDSPEVVEDSSRSFSTTYHAGEWVFELPEEDSIENALNGIASWIAWYNFLVERNKIKD